MFSGEGIPIRRNVSNNKIFFNIFYLNENSVSGDQLVNIWEVMNLMLVRLRLSNFIDAVVGASGKMLEMSLSSKLCIEPVSTSSAALTLPGTQPQQQMG